jgi:hypothetical protein
LGEFLKLRRNTKQELSVNKNTHNVKVYTNYIILSRIFWQQHPVHETLTTRLPQYHR